MHLGLAQAGLQQATPEDAQQVRVALATMGSQVPAQEDVVRQQDSVEEARVAQPQHEPKDDVVVAGRPGAERVQLDIAPRLRELLVVAGVGDRVAVPDDDPAGCHSLLHQDPQLLAADRPASGVGGDGQACGVVGPRRGPEAALLDGGHHRPVRADLADDARTDPRAADAVLALVDELRRDRVDGVPVEPGPVEVGVAVVTARHHDVEPGPLGDPPQPQGIPADLGRGQLDDGPPARRTELVELRGGEVLVTQDPVGPVLGQRVDEHVLVWQDDSEVARRHRTRHGHDRRHGLAPASPAPDVSSLGVWASSCRV